jgi:hypothetical protein
MSDSVQIDDAELVRRLTRKLEEMRSEVSILEHERRLSHDAREKQRQERHHDVLCLVLKELVRRNAGTSGVFTPKDMEQSVAGAKLAADLAYPPPEKP